MTAAGGVVGGFVLRPGAESGAAAVAAPDVHAGHATTRTLGVTGRAADAPALGSRPMPVPKTLKPTQGADGADVYTIPIQAATAELLPGHPTAVRTYAGQFPGPTIRARTGKPVRITYTNKLPTPANVHLHGGHNAAVDDGHPMDVIAPGASRTYHYPNRQRGTTLWSHDHAHHLESENVYFGLHAFYILDDPAEAALNLPTGEFDVPIMIRDAELDANGALVYPAVTASTILVNGVIAPYFKVAARKYRFRLLNASNERTFRLTLGGAAMTQIGSDGGLLPAPKVRSEIVISSAERADIVVDFSRLPIGTHLVLQDVSGPVMRFDVTRTAADTSKVPAKLRALPALPAATVQRDVVFKFDLSSPDNPIGLMNGVPYDPNRVDFQVKRGTTEIWRIINDDADIGAQHTFHMHLEQFRVLDRNGAPPTAADEGLKDTIFLAPGEIVRVQATFTDYVGLYVYHCHFLYHSVVGMMAQMEIVP